MVFKEPIDPSFDVYLNLKLNFCDILFSLTYLDWLSRTLYEIEIENSQQQQQQQQKNFIKMISNQNHFYILEKGN